MSQNNRDKSQYPTRQNNMKKHASHIGISQVIALNEVDQKKLDEEIKECVKDKTKYQKEKILPLVLSLNNTLEA
jgi:hypothetical protein